jgi:hypothetical protein
MKAEGQMFVLTSDKFKEIYGSSRDSQKAYRTSQAVLPTVA